METTQLYIELIIIGLETFTWICGLFIAICKEKALNFISYMLSHFSSSLLLIGVLYVLGLLMDRFTDMIFQNKENKIRSRSGIKAKSTMIIWEKYKQDGFSDYCRSRIRILRSSVINIPIITLTPLLFIWQFHLDNITNVIILLLDILFGTGATFLAYFAFIKMTKNYYNKAAALERSDKLTIDKNKRT